MQCQLITLCRVLLGVTMAKADLHLHSTASDGCLTPREVIQMASTKEIQIVALTDHDTTEGLQEALKSGQEFSIQVIPGIELSTEEADEEIHILGYYIDYESSFLQKILDELKLARVQRTKEIIHCLQQMDFALTWDEVKGVAAGASSIGRPHVARVMVEKGYASSIEQVFAQWIGPGGPAFVKRYKLSSAKAVEIIHSAGGLAFLAHPGLLAKGIETAEKIIPLGLDGIEVFNPEHSEIQIEEFMALAKREDLYISGGSDCHGYPGDIKMGQTTVETILLHPWLKD